MLHLLTKFGIQLISHGTASLQEKGSNVFTVNIVTMNRQNESENELSGGNHGGQLCAAAREFGLPKNKFLDFSANVNPLGLPAPVKKALKRELATVVHYPDPQCQELIEKLAAYHRVDPETLLVGNGAAELIYLLAQGIASGKTLIPVPTFCEYERAVTNFGGQVSRFYMEEKWHLNLTQLTERLTEVSAVFLCQPNNPTGHLIPRDSLLSFARQCEQLRIFLIVDEAFIDFLETAELLSLINVINQFKNLVVLRSFTKIYAFPGLRLGYLVANPSIIKRLRSLQPPWSINSLAQKAGVVALDCTDYVQRTRNLIKQERTFLINKLEKINGITPFPSEVNFILCKLDSTLIDAIALRKFLGQRGILIRECSSFHGLDEHFFRIAVRTHKENKILLNALERLNK